MNLFPAAPGREPLSVAATHRPGRARGLALTLCLIACAQRISAQSPTPTPDILAELPNSPSTVLAAATLSGTITDADNASVPGAVISLTSTRDTQPRTTVSTQDGRFTFPNLSPGTFTLSVSAPGFAPMELSPQLKPGEALELPSIVLQAAANTTVQVTATQSEIAEAQINQEEKQRVIGVFPNFYVSYIPNPVPLSPRQKFELAFKTMVDPVSLVLQGVSAGLEQADNVYDWGQGAQGYAKRYFAGYGTFLTGTLIGSAVLPIFLKQDPRYFYKGTGPIHTRALYAIANAVICKGDNHKWQPNYSAILGGLAASGLSNAWYPAPNRAGVGLTFESAGIGTGVAAIANLIQEFVVRRLTPHIPAPAPNEAVPQKATPPTAHLQSTRSDTEAHTSPPESHPPSLP